MAHAHRVGFDCEVLRIFSISSPFGKLIGRIFSFFINFLKLEHRPSGLELVLSGERVFGGAGGV